MATKASKTLSQQINEKIEYEDWRGIVRLVEKAMKDEPGGDQDHWLLDRLSAAYYELHDYDKALQLIEKANQLKPDCPLVLWDWAGTLYTMGRYVEAVKVYATIFRLVTEPSIKNFAKRQCGEGHEWAESLIADTAYRLGQCFERLGRKDDAISFYRGYIELRLEAVPSMYDVRDVRERLAVLEGSSEDTLGKRIRTMRERLELVKV